MLDLVVPPIITGRREADEVIPRMQDPFLLSFSGMNIQIAPLSE